ncbi:hypothetical protein C2G38_2175052 [Gigaspora rosea]|uniref:Uncharacterized protein n=1 Tax=Gigaspora rosea TaxID=44941 RepID=A0A397VHR5_9GLOM|nr:hypothetical protein C2G38_2175052 [Gigaspora rosea]
MKNLLETTKNLPKIDERTHDELTKELAEETKKQQTTCGRPTKNDKLAKEPTKKNDEQKIHRNTKNLRNEYAKTYQNTKNLQALKTVPTTAPTMAPMTAPTTALATTFKK